MANCSPLHVSIASRAPKSEVGTYMPTRLGRTGPRTSSWLSMGTAKMRIRDIVIALVRRLQALVPGIVVGMFVESGPRNVIDDADRREMCGSTAVPKPMQPRPDDDDRERILKFSSTGATAGANGPKWWILRYPGWK